MTASPALLRIRDVRKQFGGVPAIAGASLDVTQSTIHALIGPNGAGKTTLINVIAGYLRADAGLVELNGRAMQRLPIAARVRMGLTRTFQIRQLFGGMSAFENVLMGCHLRLANAPWAVRVWPPAVSKFEQKLGDECDALLSLVGIGEYRDVAAASLPAGVQGRLEVARALATQPTVLLLDEPCAGLDAREATEIGKLLKELVTRRPGGVAPEMSILVVEHNMPFVLGIADQVTVMDAGEVIASGPPAEVRSNQRVIDAYLGGQPDAGVSH